MKRLIIDTSTKVLGVAVVDGETVREEKTIYDVKNHSKYLMPTVVAVMQAANLQPNELEAMVVAKGPGSYTAVRIGVTVAKTLAWTLNIPLYAISSLKGMVLSDSEVFDGWIIPIIDARRGTVFTSAYKKLADGTYQCKQDQHISFAQWMDQLKQFNEPVRFIGEDIKFYREQIIENFGQCAYSLEEEKSFQLCVSRYILDCHKDTLVTDIHAFAPDYLRLAEAEQKWIEGQRL